MCVTIQFVQYASFVYFADTVKKKFFENLDQALCDLLANKKDLLANKSFLLANKSLLLANKSFLLANKSFLLANKSF